jgi:Fasciclin domain
MRKYKKISIKLLCFGLLAFGIQSCNLLGLDLQESYVYKHDPVQQKLNMTAYQFIESRKDIDMSLLYEAINKVELRDSFEVQNRTYIVMNDLAFSSYLTDNKFSGLKSMSNAQVILLLKKHIILGKYHSLSLTINPLAVQTVDPATKINLSLSPAAFDAQNKYMVLVSFVGGSITTSVYTSNLQPNNGIMHVIQNHL